MMRSAALAAVLALLGFGLYSVSGKKAPDKPAVTAKPPVKLAVVVIFDQMRGDYIEKWRHLFAEGGFKRLQDQGAWFTECRYPYGTTTTAPGHASILSGRSADGHGIVNNSWYDRMAAAEVIASASNRYETVPASAANQPVAGVRNDKRPAVGNPDRFVGETLADVVKSTTKGKVFGLSLKDRSAIFPVGKTPDGAYWFTGRFVTSTFYRDNLPRWVSDFNNSGVADQWFRKSWLRLRPDLDYDQIVGPDDGPGEGVGPGKSKSLGKTFPHTLGTEDKDKPGKGYYEDLACSPYGNELLWELAKKCILAENLGKDDAADLLTISFSSNDLIGHVWGPDSQEVLDVTLRSDRLMAEMLRFLDNHVGVGNYAVTVTADHGICPNPEVSAAKGLDAERIHPKLIAEAMEAAMVAKYGPPGEPPIVMGGRKMADAPPPAGIVKPPGRWIEAFSMPNVYFNRRALEAGKLSREAAAMTVAERLRGQRGIDRAYTAGQLAGPAPAEDPLFVPTQKSFRPANSGDLVLVTKPFYLLDTYGAGTSHGAPHPYDTHAVFLTYGPGIPGGKRTEPITPLHAAAINADYLNIRPPIGNEYALPVTLR